jgi:hypothetical protein
VLRALRLILPIVALAGCGYDPSAPAPTKTVRALVDWYLVREPEFQDARWTLFKYDQAAALDSGRFASDGTAFVVFESNCESPLRHADHYINAWGYFESPDHPCTRSVIPQCNEELQRLYVSLPEGCEHPDSMSVAPAERMER